MKTNGRIGALLGTTVRNEQDYVFQVLLPLLDELGFPKGGRARWPEFPTRNPTGDGWLKLDLLSADGDVPLLVTEAKERAAQFDAGLRQASVYGRNFEPRDDAGVRRMTVPFLLVAAGHRAEMFRATVRGIDVVYERLEGLLEWAELVAEAARFASPKVAAREDLAVAPLARQFFEAVHAAIWSARPLRRQDDKRVMLLGQVIRLARENLDHRVPALCARHGMPSAASRRVRSAIERYRSALDAHVFHGEAVARAFHDFVTGPGLHLFTGRSQHRPDLSRGPLRYRRTARYFTPRDVARQMVRLARITPHDRVVDPTCGSGTFLVEAISHVGAGGLGARFAAGNLVGIDDDPFCVETTRTLLSLLSDGADAAPAVFVHNCLYDKGPDRLFRNNQARMSIISLVRTAAPAPSRRIFCASIPDDHDTNVVAELEALTERALEG